MLIQRELESAFQIDIDGDGTITTISSSSTTAIATDTTGAQLRQTSDGSLLQKIVIPLPNHIS